MKVIFILLLIAMFLVAKLCKKLVKMVLSVAIIVTAMYCVIVLVDMYRVESFRETIFNIGCQEELGVTKYKGIGYKTIVKYDENKITSIEMYMFDKCIAGVIE